MSFTIVAKTGKSPRIKPLLWSLTSFKPNKDYELFVLTRENTYKYILDELNCYRSCIKWNILKEDENGNDWWEFIKTKKVLTLPTSSVPFKDSINKLINNTIHNFFPICKIPSANFALVTDNYSSNITEKVFDECENTLSSIICTPDFNDSNILDVEIKNSKFIVLDPISPLTYYRVKLTDSNVTNIKTPSK